MTLSPAMRATLELLPDPVVISDAGGTLRWASRQVGELLGHDTAATEDLGDFVHPGDRGTARQLIAESPEARETLRLRHADGTYRWCDVAARQLAGTSDRVFTIRDVSQHVAQLKTLEYRALRDPLTGLANRALMEERLDAVLTRAMRSGATTTLFVADLNGFKTINDTLGHHGGDLLLRAVAEALTAAVRPSDSVCRWGGDEFVVICENLADAQATQDVRDRLLSALAAPAWIDGAWRAVSGTIGMAQTGAPASLAAVTGVATQLLHAADGDMYGRRGRADVAA